MKAKPTGALSGRVALVTGAGSGIGRAASLMMAREGAAVGLLGRTEKQLKETASAIRRRKGEAEILVADLRDDQAVNRSCRELAARFGRIDVVFANAGINGLWAPLEKLSLEEWNKTLQVNLTGTFLTIKAALPQMKDGGSIIVTSSVNGTRIFSNTGATAYAVSKGGQAVLVKMLAPELAQRKIRINVICPGWIETEIRENTRKVGLEGVGLPVRFPEGNIPLTGRRPGSADQVARAVLFLASDASDHITGTELWIDGGESIVQG